MVFEGSPSSARMAKLVNAGISGSRRYKPASDAAHWGGGIRKRPD